MKKFKTKFIQLQNLRFHNTISLQIILSVCVLFEVSTNLHSQIKPTNYMLWESGLNLEIENDGQKDTISLKDIILGNDLKSNIIDHLGNEISFHKLKSKVLLIDFWNLRCKPCIAEMPGFEILTNKFDANKFQVISITFDKFEEVESKILSKRRFKFPIITNTRLIGKVIYPLKILINKRGEIIYYKDYGSQANDAHVKLVEELSPFIKKWIDK